MRSSQSGWGPMVMGAHARATAVRVGILALLLAAIAAAASGPFLSPPQGANGFRARSEPMPTWMDRLALVDEAIERQDVSRALYEWRDAYGAALRSRSWQPLLDVGDRAARIDGLLAGHFRAEARSAYLAALFSAHRERATAGVLSVAKAFERLGDAEVASRARRMVPPPPVQASAGTP